MSPGGCRKAPEQGLCLPAAPCLHRPSALTPARPPTCLALSGTGAAGFRQLTYLHIEQSSAAWSSAPIRSTPQHEGGRLLLPPEWASSGGFPALDVLELIRLPVEGSLPTEWVEGGFANLGKLMISGGQLTGTLPPQLFDRHPKLQVLSLEGNRLHGTLPGSYGSSQVGRARAWATLVL